MDDLQAATRAAAAPIADLNRATVERLLQVLPANSGERVRRTFERMAWPRIYGDRSCAAPLLAAALNLDGLTPLQRDNVENLAVEYNPAYEEMCRNMIASVEGLDCPLYAHGNIAEEQWIAFNQRSSEPKRLLFDRHELNVRVWQRLKGILTDEQAKAIGMRATPAEGPGENEDFGS